ncbi:hypothetical protein [Lacibacter sp. H407]|uniref:hypothetical protein n=1 Tax=Lacibacter sp. H407 TaxID=3133423 RepID=UPI0030C64A52
MKTIKQFIVRLFVFFAGVISLALALILLGNKAASETSLYRTVAGKTIFLFGHSRTAYAYNDSLIPRVRNFANTAEPYFFTSAKVDKLLSANPQVKTIVVELSEIHMSERQTNEWTNGNGFIQHHLPNYGPLITLKQHCQLLQRNTKEYLNTLPLTTKQNLLLLLKPKQTIFSSRNFGGYLVHDSSLVDFKRDQNNQNPKKGLMVSDSSPDLVYLDAIAELCNQKKVRLILLRSPVHRDFGMGGYDSVWHSVYRTKYSNYTVIDFSSYPLPDEGFYDYHHLNRRGAGILSPKLDSALYAAGAK